MGNWLRNYDSGAWRSVDASETAVWQSKCQGREEPEKTIFP